jgi:hypothetical protein
VRTRARVVTEVTWGEVALASGNSSRPGQHIASVPALPRTGALARHCPAVRCVESLYAPAGASAEDVLGDVSLSEMDSEAISINPSVRSARLALKSVERTRVEMTAISSSHGPVDAGRLFLLARTVSF